MGVNRPYAGHAPFAGDICFFFLLNAEEDGSAAAAERGGASRKIREHLRGCKQPRRPYQLRDMSSSFWGKSRSGSLSLRLPQHVLLRLLGYVAKSKRKVLQLQAARDKS